ncbi:hypothetical protein NBT05_01295 [Aquimarina sp. ERC-38]|uniref:hypothetical protein n=1 Tax=Aquimarina sp. ERC-38 TaxID=2949996 RepID=UPI00224614CF|nr:hypothetical protein [Aquimarina sp. ERC-38]UZO81127.1 hypothetical protein NBT05_01295 [Aquimarina sp. ERC-38]
MLPKQNARVGKSFKAPASGLKRLSSQINKFSRNHMTILQLPFVTVMNKNSYQK